MAYRPMLRPGACVLRRDAAHLQVGTSPGTVVADRPGLHQLLLALDGVHGPTWLAEQVPEICDDVPAVLAHLTATGVVLDATHCDGRRPEEARRLALTGRDPLVATTRHHLRVSLHADPGTRPLLDAVGQIIGEAGLGSSARDDADLLVIASTGEPTRDPFAEAVRSGIAHLVVRLDETAVRIGPLVVPGISACLNCEDLHHIDWDPAWAALLPQLGRRGSQHNLPAPGAVLRHAAAAAIAGSIVEVADRRRPLHAGCVVSFGLPPATHHVRPAAFHHRCPCALLPRA